MYFILVHVFITTVVRTITFFTAAYLNHTAGAFLGSMINFCLLGKESTMQMTENQFYLLMVKVIAMVIAPWQLLSMVVPSETFIRYSSILDVLFYLDVAIGAVYFMVKTSNLEEIVPNSDTGTSLSNK